MGFLRWGGVLVVNGVESGEGYALDKSYSEISDWIEVEHKPVVVFADDAIFTLHEFSLDENNNEIIRFYGVDIHEGTNNLFHISKRGLTLNQENVLDGFNVNYRVTADSITQSP